MNVFHRKKLSVQQCLTGLVKLIFHGNLNPTTLNDILVPSYLKLPSSPAFWKTWDSGDGAGWIFSCCCLLHFVCFCFHSLFFT